MTLNDATSPSNGELHSTLDPSGLGCITALPFVPEPILRQHRAFISTDNRFRAAARLLQALWREDRNLPIGVHPGRDGKSRRLGSSIAMSAGATGANFIHPAIARLAKRELIYREAGASYDDNRLLTNLLSSQPLVFNLFGPLKLDLAMATAVFDALAPGFMSEVTEILFEHAVTARPSIFSSEGLEQPGSGASSRSRSNIPRTAMSLSPASPADTMRSRPAPAASSILKILPFVQIRCSSSFARCALPIP